MFAIGVSSTACRDLTWLRTRSIPLQIMISCSLKFEPDMPGHSQTARSFDAGKFSRTCLESAGASREFPWFARSRSWLTLLILFRISKDLDILVILSTRFVAS